MSESYLCPKTHKPRLNEDSTKKLHQTTSRPRLGEPLWPKREYLSLRTKTSRLDEKLRWTCTSLIATSLRRASLAWASERVAQTQTSSPEWKARTKTMNEFLQLSPRREGLAWAKLAEFRHCSRTQNTKTIPIYNEIILIQCVSSIKP